MTVRFDDVRLRWEALVAGRHSVTGQPMNLKRVGFKTKAAALRAEAEMKEALARKAVESKAPKWNEVVELCLKHKADSGFDSHTLHCYRSGLNAHTSLWASRSIDTITKADILSIVREKMIENKPSHQKNVLKYIRAVFNFAFDTGIIDKSPVPHIKFKKTEKLEEVLNLHEASRFLREAKNWDSEWYPLWATALYTGMRSGELFALRWENVDLDNRLIFVRKSWTKKEGFKDYPKGAKHRVLEIAQPLIPLLTELKLKTQMSGFVLPRLDDWERGEQAGVTRSFLVSIGIRSIRFHALRATWATLLLSRGVPAIKVQKAGGWECLKTMERYLRMAGVDIKGMMDGFSLHDHHRSIAEIISVDFAGLESPRIDDIDRRVTSL